LCVAQLVSELDIILPIVLESSPQLESCIYLQRWTTTL